jgi:hypothetical protein
MGSLLGNFAIVLLSELFTSGFSLTHQEKLAGCVGFCINVLTSSPYQQGIFQESLVSVFLEHKRYMTS